MPNLFQSFNQSIKYWYVQLIIGILLICLGVYVFMVPLETYLTLAMVFSWSFIISGLLDTVFAIQNNKSLRGWGWYLVSGLASIAMGVYLIMYPDISIMILPFVVGFALLFRSFLLLGFAFDLRDLKQLNWGNVALLSVLGILFSILLLSNPFFTGISLVTLTGISFMLVGVSSIVLSLQLKKAKDMPAKISNDLKNKLSDLNEEINKQLGK